MAFTPEQEQQLLELLKTKKVTLNELPAASEINDNDLLLTRQGITDKSITSGLLQAQHNKELLKKSANLTDVADKTKARTALGLGKLAVKDELSASEVGALQQNKNLADIQNINAAHSNLQLGTAALRNVGTAAGQIPDIHGFPWSAASNGWCKLPNGLMLQWWQDEFYTTKTVGATTGFIFSYHSTTFPIAFPSTCLSVQLSGTPQPGWEVLEHVWGLESVALTNATIVGLRWSGSNTSGTESAKFYLFAVGY